MTLETGAKVVVGRADLGAMGCRCLLLADLVHGVWYFVLCKFALDYSITSTSVAWCTPLDCVRHAWVSEPEPCHHGGSSLTGWALSACQVENTMLQNPKFVEFCELNYTDVNNPICIPPQSPLPFFFQFDVANQTQGYGDPIRTPAEGLALMSQVRAWSGCHCFASGTKQQGRGELDQRNLVVGN